MPVYHDVDGHARWYDEYGESRYSYSDYDYFDNSDDDYFDDNDDGYLDYYECRSSSPPSKALPTLVDSCCKILSANFPISYVQDQWKTVPDELQLKVISSSFPAEFPATVGSSSSDSSNRGYSIPTIIQTGCEIRATVMDNYVTIHFDRGKFTSVDCTCNYHKNRAEDDPMNRWCAHVREAVAMRINYPEKIKYYLSPINESLQKLDRMKLLKLTGSLLNRYTNTPVVDSAQEQLDQLLNKSKNSKAFIDVSGNPIPSASPFVACSSSSSGFDSVTPFLSSLSSKRFKMYHDLKDNSTSSLKQTTVKEACVRSLVDCCCNVLSANFSISYVQDQWETVPDELQLKVISSSFPVDKEKVMKIANFCDPFEARFTPQNMKQIGCRLSAKVLGFFFVTIFFDRRKITSAHCSCHSQSPWCQHVQDTALERIRHPERATYHLPITDSLYQLNRDELLRLASMLLNYPDEIEMVDNAFQVMDELLNKNGQHCHAEINVMDGVPDATAGPGVDEESHWVISKADISQFFIETYRLVKPIIPEIKISSNTPASPSYTQESQEPQEETRHCKRPFRISSPVIKGTCTEHFSSSHFLPTKLLDTVYSLLYEDIDDVLFIITKTLVDHLEYNYVAKWSWKTYFLDLPITSLAMSFTATPFSCGTLCDELSRLWLLVVLNPKMSHRKKEVLTGWLEELDLESYFRYDNTECEVCSLQGLQG
ncbi:zinc finger SWIM domain-containing protein 8-like [Nematostella vectensis]|uniref:zinc finger SWIM domain-containing protein 8-like n=1 Tax=Nematostella vectensis TaxID=45351 RepID=UPI0020779777|nr:zinc finger SWIM domain-containing protein 8-like [Nematostella vectensis]